MKRLFTFLPSIFVLSLVIAQSPQKFSFQTVIRNSNNVLVANQQIGLRVSILQGSENGVIAYSERHNPLTNANGLASVQIGGGQILGGNFQNIDWANGLYFVKTDTDINGGTNYSISAT